MKFRNFLVLFRFIIMLIWWLVILLVFKFTNNFVFKNGQSILFIALMVIVPLGLHIYTLLIKKSLLKKKKLSKGNLFLRINNDFEEKRFQHLFLEQIKRIKEDFIVLKKEDEILLESSNIQIIFTKRKASLIIKETRVVFNFFYSLRFENYSVFDKRFFQYKETTYLYNTIINQLSNLIKEPLEYFENKKDCRLISSISRDVLFQSTNTKKLSKNPVKIFKI